MNDPAGESQSRRHSLSDWLALHELDPESCRRMLGAMASGQLSAEPAGEPAAKAKSSLGYTAPELEAAWLSTAAAMRDFFAGQEAIIDDTFDKTERILVERRDKSRRALTLDNGPAAYPTILFSYDGDPGDCLTIAHEFGHALQIRASRGKFVAPIMREVCAFLGEGALLAHILDRDAAQHACLDQVWRRENRRYFGAQRDRLQAALLRPDEPYAYAWNYPIARYLAIRIAQRCSRDWIWSVFEGGISVREAMRELARSAGPGGA